MSATPTPELVALLELSESELIAKLLEALKDCVRSMDIARDTIQPLTMAQLKLHNLDPQTDKKLDSAAQEAMAVIGLAVIKDAATRAATVPQGDQDALDARRYRFLRDDAHPDSDDGLAVTSQSMTDWGKWYAKHYSGANLDAAIDAAMPPPPAELGDDDGR